MAQDGYRGATEPPPPFYNHPDSRSQNSHPYYPTDPYRSRSRHSSRDRAEPRAAPEPLRFSQSQRPIDEAVSTAFNQTDMSGINPDLVAQITQNVIHQLRTSIDSGTPVTATQNHYPSVPLQQPVPLSPSTQSNTSPPIPSRNVYTPPSPQKHTDLPSHNSPESRPPMPQDSPPSPKDQREYDQRSHSRASIGSDANVTRPKGPDRLSTALEETPLEKIWGQLFDEHGKPTARLSQFLRGLAVHLV